MKIDTRVRRITIDMNPAAGQRIACTLSPELSTDVATATIADGYAMCSHCCDTLLEHEAEAIAAADAEDKAIRRALIGMGLPPHEADGTIRDHGFMYRVARDQVRGITHTLPDEPVTHCTLCGGVETVPGVCDRH